MAIFNFMSKFDDLDLTDAVEGAMTEALLLALREQIENVLSNDALTEEEEQEFIALLVSINSVLTVLEANEDE